MIRIEQLERDLEYKDKQIIYENEKYDKLMQGVIDTCGVELAADVLLASGCQGTKDSTVNYVEKVKENYCSKGK